MNIHSAMRAARRRNAPRKRVEESPRQAILDAACELFADRGFNGTAVPLVAELAGVGAGTVYRYFDSKEALVNALYQFWKERFGRTLMDGFPFQAPVRDQFRFFWRKIDEFARKHARAFAFLELHYHSAYLDAKSRRLEIEILGPIKAFIEDAQRSGVLKDLPAELIMALVYGSFVGLVRASWAGYLALTPEVLDAAEASVWDAIRR